MRIFKTIGLFGVVVYYSATPITIFGSKIIIHEGLFHYLEKIGWMHPYTMTWWCNNADW